MRRRAAGRIRAVRAAGVAALCALACGPAAADPVTIAYAVAEVFWTAVTVAEIYGTYITIALTVYGGIEARRKARAAADAARAQYNASLVDRNITALTADPPLRAIYGRCLTGGDIVAVLTSDKDAWRDDGTHYVRPDAYKHLVIVLAAREVAAIHDVSIDGVAVGALDADGWATGGDFSTGKGAYREVTLAPGESYTAVAAITVNSFGYHRQTENGTEFVPVGYTLSNGDKTITNTGGGLGDTATGSLSWSQANARVRISKLLGTPDQAADPWLLANVASQWTSADRLRGLAAVVVTLDLEDGSFTGGPPHILVDVSGHKLYDPRTGTTVWSANPALVARDYLCSEIGFGCASADMDDAYTITAANACDVAATIDGTSQALYTCNGTVNSDDSRERVLDDLAESMAGQIVYGARWMIMAGTWTAPVMDLDDGDLQGQISIRQTGAGIDDVFNGLRGKYIPAGSAVVADATYQSASMLAADGGVPLWSTVERPFTNSATRAANVMRALAYRERSSEVLLAPCKLKAWPLQMGDRVRLTNAEYGIPAGSTYRVTDWQFGLQAPVVLTLQADTSGNYAQASDVTPPTPPASTLANPWVVARVLDCTAVSGTANMLQLASGTRVNRIRLTWQALTDTYVTSGGQIMVRWRRPGIDPINTWQSTAVAGGAAAAWLDGVAEGDVVTIRIAAINNLGVEGASTTISHTVTGHATLGWSAVTGAGKPAAYATVGKSLGLPFESWVLNGQSIVDLVYGKVGRSALRLSPGGYPNQGNYVAIDRTKKYRVRFWATPIAATNGVLYFSLRQYTDASGTVGPVNSGRSPYKPSNQSRAAHNTQYGTDEWGEYSYIWDAADWQTGTQFVVPEFLDNYGGTAGYWYVQDFSLEEVTEVLGAQVSANAAATAASNAATAAASARDVADAATAALATIASNNWLSKGEKPDVILRWAAISDEQAGIDARATAMGITTEKTAYDAKVAVLAAYLAGLSPTWSDVTQDTEISSSAFLGNFANVYATRQALLNKIAEVAATLATWASVTGTGKPADNATRNNLTYSTTAPSSPADGDLWCDTSVTPRVWRIRLAGAWQAAASYVTDTAQISDGAQLGLTALWGGVTGSGRPADGATVNRLTYSATAPSSPVDGDLWVDTSASPAVIKLRTGGAWQAGANLSTGALAQLNSVDTAQIGAGAATVVYQATASAVTVDGETGAPTGTFTDLVTYTWTPPYSCIVEISAEGSATITTPSSGTSNNFATLSTRFTLNGTQDGPLRTYHIDLPVGYSQIVSAVIARNRQISVTGGTSYALKLQGQKLATGVSTVVDTVTLKIVEIRR